MTVREDGICVQVSAIVQGDLGGMLYTGHEVNGGAVLGKHRQLPVRVAIAVFFLKYGLDRDHLVVNSRSTLCLWIVVGSDGGMLACREDVWPAVGRS